MRFHDTDHEVTAIIPIQTLRELASIPHSPAPHMENSMPEDNWTLESVRADTVKRRRQFDLRLERRVMGALVKVEEVSNGQRVTVTFTHERVAHARAEAARFYAMVLDTVGDMLGNASDEPLQIDPDILFTGTYVELEGQDAFLVTCQHFGGDFGTANAADAMMSAI